MKNNKVKKLTEQLSDAIKAAEKRGDTQSQIALRADMPRSQLSRIAKGESIPRVDTAEKIANVLGFKLILVAN